MSEDTSGVNAAQIEFFNALQNSANYSDGLGQKEIVFSAAKLLVNRIKTLDRNLDDIKSAINQKTLFAVKEVNDLSSSLIEINNKIGAAVVSGRGTPPNDLMDHRDQVLNQLSEFFNIRTVETEDGGMDVFVGNGIPIVAGRQNFELEVTPDSDGSGNYSLGIRVGDDLLAFGNEITGGSIGGQIEFLNETLDPIRAELGRMTTSLATTFNDQYQLLTDQSITTFFQIGEIQSYANSANTGSASITVERIDPAQSTTSDYRMAFDGSEYTLTRLFDNVQISGANDLVMDGLRFSASGAAAAGDEFLLRPAVGAASDLNLSMSSASDLQLSVTDPDGVVRTIGDQLSLLQQQDLLGPNTSVAEVIASVSVQAGSTARTSALQMQSMEQVWELTRQQHDSISTVNLDEEAANLMKYQQAYEASARVIAVSGTLFDTLIGTLNRT